MRKNTKELHALKLADDKKMELMQAMGGTKRPEDKASKGNFPSASV